jgi:hypothetical protein
MRIAEIAESPAPVRLDSAARVGIVTRPRKCCSMTSNLSRIRVLPMPPLRRALLFVAIALLAALPGCVSDDSMKPTTSASFRLDTETLGDRALLDVALVQAPLGDAFLDRKIWSSVDQMICPADKRDLLEANGLRLGILVGAPPSALTNLLQTERTCVERHGRFAPSGMTVNQLLRTATDTIECRIQRIGRIETATLDRPNFSLDFTPKRLNSTTVRLGIVPCVETGDQRLTYKPVPEESKWTLDSKRARLPLAEFGFDIDLVANQILLIGCRSEREETIGFAGFVRLDGPEPMQRLLVVRQMPPSAAVAP